MIGFIGASFTVSLNYSQYSGIADLLTFQFTVAHVLGFSVSTSRLLATDLNTETSTSEHYEVFLLFLFSHSRTSELNQKFSWTGLSLDASGFVLYSRGTVTAENTALLLSSADDTENTSHVIAKYCGSLMSLRLRGSVFNEPLPRSGLLKPVFHCWST
jgi:hypothetical protein